MTVPRLDTFRAMVARSPGNALARFGLDFEGPEHDALADARNLARLVMVYDPFKVGDLHRLIRAINALESAPPG